MSSPFQDDSAARLIDMISSCQRNIQSCTGAERVLAYTAWSLLKEGYYSPDELIDLSLSHNFTIDNPIVKIRRGTQIGENVIIRNGTVIQGERVSIGEGTILDNTQIYGNDIKIGSKNFVSGAIRPGNTILGTHNEIYGIFGENDGTLTIGNYNKIDRVNIHNPGKQQIIIGNHNELHQGLSISCPFPQGRIRIGDYNSLGRDGGGVISSTYRFNRKWWGDILIGSHVETTRGAEILGFSLIGWPLSKEDEKTAQHLLVDGSIPEVIAFFAKLWDQDIEARPQRKSVSLFGVVKTKMCCLAANVKVKDGTRIQRSFMKDIFTTERCKIYFTVVDSPSLLHVTVQDRAIEHMIITQPIDWAQLPIEEKSDGYRKEESDFYTS